MHLFFHMKFSENFITEVREENLYGLTAPTTRNFLQYFFQA
jgi:hypothetical protein